MIARGGSCGAVVSGVCVSVVAVGLLGGWYDIAGNGVAGPNGLSCWWSVRLRTSKSCLLYFSGSGCLRIVLALITLPGMPIKVSPVEVSLPSQIPGMKRCSIFGSCLLVGSRYCTVSPNSQSGCL